MGASRVVETRGSCLHLLVAVSEQSLKLAKECFAWCSSAHCCADRPEAEMRSKCGVTSYGEIISRVLRPISI
jgi:hypothetical protein